MLPLLLFQSSLLMTLVVVLPGVIGLDKPALSQIEDDRLMFLEGAKTVNQITHVIIALSNHNPAAVSLCSLVATTNIIGIESAPLPIFELVNEEQLDNNCHALLQLKQSVVVHKGTEGTNLALLNLESKAELLFPHKIFPSSHRVFLQI